MGHSEDDADHKIPHEMQTHWQNQLKILVFRVDFISPLELDDRC